MAFLKKKDFDPILLGIALLAGFLNLFGIWKDQYANAYYTAAVTSMLQSFHNFFFASFDPGGFVTVDKPPVAFWIQTLSASIFGVRGWSVILPQALAGFGSVFLIYALVKPSFGKTAARTSALMFACTPIAVAVSRTNNVDSLLVFTLLSASWFLFKAVKTKKWVWSVAAFALIGVGFNIKMLQAYMIVPAFYFFYWLAFNVQWKQKLKGLAVSSVVLLLISLSWPVIVDSIPKADRPYIGGSKTNSVLELAFGYNGMSRLTGMGGPGGRNPNGNWLRNDEGNSSQDGNQSNGQQGQQTPGQNQNDGLDQELGAQMTGGSQGFGPGPNGNPGQMPSFDGTNQRGAMRDGGFAGGQGGPGGGGMFNTGTAGPLRLFQSQLSGQISWLLPFALLAGVGLVLGIRRRQPLTDKQKETLFWLAWLLPMMGFFSIAGFFHQYYLIMLAPAIAALTGAGWVELYHFNRNREGWKKWLLPVGLLGTTGFQLYILMPYMQQIGSAWLIAIGAIGTVLSLVVVVAMKKEKLTRIAAVGGILILLAAPLYWAATPLIYGDNSMMPAAGPQSNLTANRGGMPNRTTSGPTNGMLAGMPAGMRENVNIGLLNYLLSHNTGEKYLFATINAGTAEPYIIQTGKAVMTMGGFSGSDPILTLDQLKQTVENKQVKYFLISSDGPGEGQGSSQVLTWIKENGKEIAQSEWQVSTGTSQTSQAGMGRNGGSTLYEVDPGQGGGK